MTILFLYKKYILNDIFNIFNKTGNSKQPKFWSPTNISNFKLFCAKLSPICNGLHIPIEKPYLNLFHFSNGKIYCNICPLKSRNHLVCHSPNWIKCNEFFTFWPKNDETNNRQSWATIITRSVGPLTIPAATSLNTRPMQCSYTAKKNSNGNQFFNVWIRSL